jgi:enamine deaminase RidA (YjgF/YER057c/UK114 family)
MVLEAADCTLADIVDSDRLAASPRDFAAFNAVYAEHFPASKPT